MFRAVFRTLFFVVLFVGVYSHASEWRYSIGAGMRNQTPVVLIGGVGYSNLMLYVQGMGFHNGPNDYWCGIRGSALWTFFKDFPFNLDAGVGVGYEYAESPNKMHQALNKANSAMYALPYNYKEIADVSIELWTHLYGLYTQISIPVNRYREHDTKKLLWGAGYIYEF